MFISFISGISPCQASEPRPIMNPGSDCGPASSWWGGCNQFTRIRRRHALIPRSKDRRIEAQNTSALALLARQASFSVYVIAILCSRRRPHCARSPRSPRLIRSRRNGFCHRRVLHIVLPVRFTARRCELLLFSPTISLQLSYLLVNQITL